MDFLFDVYTFILTYPGLALIFAFFILLQWIYGCILVKRNNLEKYSKYKKHIDYSAKIILFLLLLFFLAIDFYLNINDIETPKDFFRLSAICQLAMSVIISILNYYYDRNNKGKNSD